LALKLLPLFCIEFHQNLSESDRMLLEKRALWLRKEEARKKRAAEVIPLIPSHEALQLYESSVWVDPSPDCRPAD
jgi:hypothetical protein